MPFHTEEHLRGRAAKELELLVKGSTLFGRMPPEVPTFSLAECHAGPMLGSGGFSHVYEVSRFDISGTTTVLDEDITKQGKKYLSSNVLKNGQSRYAIKALKNDTLRKAKSNKEEVQGQFVAGVMDLALEVKFLSVLRHPHIVKMRGLASCHPCSESFFIILDRLYDTLKERVEKWSKISRKVSGVFSLILDKNGVKRKKFMANRICAAYEICSAIHYLHMNGIIYRDLKPENVGFDVRDEVKLFDFGLARETNLGSGEAVESSNGMLYTMSGDAGSLRWMAPEVAAHQPYNRKVDIYSFGLILWEICCLEVPYSNLTPKNFREKVFEKGERPPLSEKILSTPISRLLTNCWSTQISDRPDCSEILSILKSEILGVDSSLVDQLDVSNQTEKSMAENSS